ncbi:MAG: putative RNA methyltransferase [Gemmatimonadota bacterium]
MGAGRGPCAELLVCPVCGERLSEVDARSLRCPRRHTFDLARQRYVDLLPAGHGRTGKSGDTAEMLRARRRFLERGRYAALTDAIVREVVDEAAGWGGADGSRFTVVDVGSGEGHHIGRIAEALAGLAWSGEPCLFGLDISKAAVKLAARRHPGVRFFVNDVQHRICLADGCVDVVLDAFAPRNAEEFGRIARPGGIAVVAIPTERHLGELRAVLPLLEIEPGKEARTVERFAPAFELEASETVERRVGLAADDVLDLLRMTPNYWHLGEAALERAEALGGMEVTLGFRILRFRRAGAGSAVGSGARG